jgi:hypothetical protein
VNKPSAMLPASTRHGVTADRCACYILHSLTQAGISIARSCGQSCKVCKVSYALIQTLSSPRYVRSWLHAFTVCCGKSEEVIRIVFVCEVSSSLLWKVGIMRCAEG